MNSCVVGKLWLVEGGLEACVSLIFFSLPLFLTTDSPLASFVEAEAQDNRSMKMYCAGVSLTKSCSSSGSWAKDKKVNGALAGEQL